MITPARLCGRCGHPDHWHRHDDAADVDSSAFRCIGYDCDAPGDPVYDACGCPDFVSPTVSDETAVVGPVYLAGPITPKAGRTLEANIASAAKTLAYLTSRRVAAYAPQITACRAELSDDALGYETWMAVDFVLLGVSVAVLALPGWDTSAGTLRELNHAADKGIPVFYAVRPLFEFLGISARAAKPVGKG